LELVKFFEESSKNLLQTLTLYMIKQVSPLSFGMASDEIHNLFQKQLVHKHGPIVMSGILHDPYFLSFAG
jgi:hypothetical protein